LYVTVEHSVERDILNAVITKQEKIAKLKEWFSKTQLTASIVNETVGINASSITPLLLLKTSEKLLKINKKEIGPDDRDNLKYFSIRGVEDLVQERIEKDVGQVQRKFNNKLKQKKNLSFLNSGFFNSQVKGAFVGHALSQLPEQVNPLEIVDISSKISKLGEGAITSTTSAPDEARHVHSSYFGFLDPFKASESESVGLDYRANWNTAKTKDGKMLTIIRDNKDGKLKWISHTDLLNSTVDIPNH